MAWPFYIRPHNIGAPCACSGSYSCPPPLHPHPRPPPSQGEGSLCANLMGSDLVSGSAKNFPRLTPRAMAMRSSDPMDGVTWRFSAWEIRPGEKPVLAARARTDIPKPRRSCRMRSPTFTELIGGSSCCDAMVFHIGLELTPELD